MLVNSLFSTDHVIVLGYLLFCRIIYWIVLTIKEMKLELSTNLPFVGFFLKYLNMEQDLFRNLPSDIVIDIFSRLPLVSIIRCKCVCKSWFDLVKSPEFLRVNESRRSTEYNSWTIFVDSASLEDESSRMELEKLRGFEGTLLVILSPVLSRVCMWLSRSESSPALDWLHDCTVSTKWWIHIPHDRFYELVTPFRSGLWFSDHTLEAALSFKQTMSGQFVLITDDDYLRFKATSAGVMCMTAKEFRVSLVSDDKVLREKYYTNPSKQLRS